MWRSLRRSAAVSRPPPRRPKAGATGDAPSAHGCRATAAGCARLLIGAISLALFLLAWHLLTTYRVVFFVRFTNVPSPEPVFDSLSRRCTIQVLHACDAELPPILIGFSLAAVDRGAARPGDGPLQAPSTNSCFR